jgi:hypothetical protein
VGGCPRSSASSRSRIHRCRKYTVLDFIGTAIGKQQLDGTVDVLEVTVKGVPSTFYFDVDLGGQPARSPPQRTSQPSQGNRTTALDKP